MTLLSLRGVSKAYRTGSEVTPVLVEADLELPRGEITALMGPSGSGKSTLLALIAGMLLADAGTISLDGQDLAALSDRRRARLRARRIGVVLQGSNLVPYLSAAENIRLSRRLARRGIGRGEIGELLGRVGLADRAGHLPRRLSGGEAQRTALSVALANGPDLLLADEVLGALDSATARLVVGELQRACAERGMAVLLVTHSAEVAALGSRVFRLHEGKVLAA